MEINLDGLGTAGWTFTEWRMGQLNSMFEFINQQDPKKKFIYTDLQNNIEQKVDGLDDSKVRMFFPRLKYYGIFNDYNSINTYEELYTELGKAFALFSKIYITSKKSEKQKDNQLNQETIKTINDVFRDFIFQFYSNILYRPEGKLYVLIHEYLKENEKLTYNEFHIFTHSINNNKSQEWIDLTFGQLKKNKDNIIVNIDRNRNSYGYHIPFLIEAGIVIKDENKTIYPDHKNNFDKVVLPNG